MEPNTKHIVVYSKAGCPFCSLLKNGLRRRGKEYVEIDVSDDATRQGFYDAAGVNTVPQLFITDQPCTPTQPSGERVGGWSEVSKAWETLDF